MTPDKIADFLLKRGVRPQLFAINTVAVDEAVVLYQQGPREWAVFFAERGERISERIYDSQAAARQDFVQRALAMERFARSHGAG